MELTLMNYASKKVSVDIGNREDIADIFISVISGDEIANITYKDYSHKSFDSADLTNGWRMMDSNDGGYFAYNFKEENNLIDNPKWVNRTSSYDGFDVMKGGAE